MALRLRRGTDAERLLITPVQGELIYTTDTKLLYVGDGSTAGGTLVTGAGGGSTTLDALTDTDLTGAAEGEVLAFVSGTNKWQPVAIGALGNITLDSLTDTNLIGLLDNDILSYNVSTSKWEPINVEDLISGTGIQASLTITADDSSVMVDPDTKSFNGLFNGDLIGDVTGDVEGNLIGTVIGDVIGNTTGYHLGDVQGSVFGDDSSLLVDGNTGTIRGSVNAPSVQGGNIKLTTVSSDNTMYLRTNGSGNFFTISTEDTAGTVLITSNAQVGAPLDPVERTFRLYNSTTSAAEIALTQIHNTDTGPGGSIGILRSRGSKTVPTAVQSGDAIGTFITAGFNGATYRSAGGIRVIASGAPQAAYIPSNVEILTAKSDGTNEVKLTVKNTGETVFTGAATLVTYADAAARDAAIPSPVAGMMVFVTNVAQFQGNTNGTIGGWVSLN